MKRLTLESRKSSDISVILTDTLADLVQRLIMLVEPPIFINQSFRLKVNQSNWFHQSNWFNNWIIQIKDSVLNRGERAIVSFLLEVSQLKVLWHIVIILAEVSTWVAEIISFFRWFEHKDIANNIYEQSFPCEANDYSRYKQASTFWPLLRSAALWLCSFAAHQVVFQNANVLLTGSFAKISVAKSWLLGSDLGPGFSARDITFGGF